MPEKRGRGRERERASERERERARARERERESERERVSAQTSGPWCTVRVPKESRDADFRDFFVVPGGRPTARHTSSMLTSTDLII